jgi:hypothetical protein
MPGSQRIPQVLAPYDAGVIEGVALIVFGGLLTGFTLLVFYGWPIEPGLARAARSRLVYHQLRTGMFVGGSRVLPGQLPFGLSVLLVGVQKIVEAINEAPQALGDGAITAAAAALFLAFGLMIHAPSWTLPKWYVEERRRQKAGLEPAIPPPPEGAAMVVSRRVRNLLLVGFGVFSAVYLALGLPIQYLLFGLAGGVSVLSVAQVRD